ncbi:MAG: hypothetical protein ACXABY_03680 [Candidatus Thorarchaeota archaeon]|jgi:hypothetical protein
MGLTEEAIKWLHKNCVKVLKYTKVFPDDREDEEVWEWEVEVYQETNSWYGEGYSLKRYRLANGLWVYEYIQAEPWSSGPCTFLALSWTPDGKDPIEATLWSDGVLDNY